MGNKVECGKWGSKFGGKEDGSFLNGVEKLNDI